MTLTLFLSLLAALSTISSLVTQALKKIFGDTKSTIIVGIVAAIVGWGGGACSYLFMNIPYTAQNIVCLILLAPAVFLSATLGYDKVKEVLQQIGVIPVALG